MKRFFKTILTIFSAYNFFDAIVILVSYVRFVARSRFSENKQHFDSVINFSLTFPNRSVLFGQLVEIFFARVYKIRSEKRVQKIIDCGSNIGVSVLYFKWRCPRADILCFEPNPEAFRYLQDNMKNNQLENIQARQLALGNNTRQASLFIEDVVQASTGASLAESVSLSKKDSVQVEVVPLSGFIQSNVDYVKLDVEGAEFEIIEDLKKNNKLHFISQLSIEYHFSILGSELFTKLISILKESGFICMYQHSPMHKSDGQMSGTSIISAWRE